MGRKERPARAGMLPLAAARRTAIPTRCFSCYVPEATTEMQRR
jgi:hypothetical protein